MPLNHGRSGYITFENMKMLNSSAASMTYDAIPDEKRAEASLRERARETFQAAVKTKSSPPPHATVIQKK